DVGYEALAQDGGVAQDTVKQCPVPLGIGFAEAFAIANMGIDIARITAGFVAAQQPCVDALQGEFARTAACAACIDSRRAASGGAPRLTRRQDRLPRLRNR